MRDWRKSDLDCFDMDDLIELVQEELESIKVPNTSYNLMDYTNGRCHLFAQALHEELGYEMEFLWDNDYWFEDAEAPSIVLIHAYSITPQGTLVDARGLVTKEMIEREYECNSHFYEKTSLEELNKAIEFKRLCKQEKKEIKTLKAFIRENISVYQ